MSPDNGSPRFAARPRAGDASATLALETFIPYRLSILTNTVSDSIARLYRERFGLSVAEWRTMAVLARFAPLSANAVCEKTRMDKVAVSRAVNRLVANGLVERRTDAADRRRTELRLSARGRRIHRRIVPLAEAREAALLDGLSARERSQLDRLLNRLQARADALAGD